MNIEALKYYHRLRHEGFSPTASRNSTIFMFNSGFADLTKRMHRYIDHRFYHEFMRFGIDDAGIISRGSEGELMQSLNRKAHPKFRV